MPARILKALMPPRRNGVTCTEVSSRSANVRPRTNLKYAHAAATTIAKIWAIARMPLATSVHSGVTLITAILPLEDLFDHRAANVRWLGCRVRVARRRRGLASRAADGVVGKNRVTRRKRGGRSSPRSGDPDAPLQVLEFRIDSGQRNFGAFDLREEAVAKRLLSGRGIGGGDRWSAGLLRVWGASLVRAHAPAVRGWWRPLFAGSFQPRSSRPRCQRWGVRSAWVRQASCAVWCW